ncbi:MAG: SusC/RagA family TonB-linked outer membrane protein [Bacteroidia bacterium]|nr:SusC/RagA family TonB-linked outer membrane protein [Bacteroidia bacterium]
MRVFIVFLFIGLLSANATTTYSQETLVSLKMKNASIKDIISEIEKKSDIYFAIDDGVRNKLNDIKVDLDVSNELISEVLKQLTKNTNLKFDVFKKQVIIYAEKAKPASSASLGENMASAKPIIISGAVMDAKGAPLIGVTIKVKDTSQGTTTDQNGFYEITLDSDKNNILVFSYIGFTTKEIAVKDKKTINVTLQESLESLNEVTVIAYGERSNKELISSISSVKAKDIEELPSSSIENLLQGHMSGVEVTNIAGAPGGGGTQVTVRGYNSLMINGVNDGSPLYVIDGVPAHSFTSPVTGTNTLAGLDPSVIESVEVLKDAASASIYGSRASNGVILITTKKGKTGRATFAANVSYSHSMLIETPTQLIGHGERLWHLQTAKNNRVGVYDMIADTYKFPKSYKDVYNSDDISASYDFFWNRGVPFEKGEVFRSLQDSLNTFYNNSTNWWKYVFKPGKILNANIQASGGTENIQYMVGSGIYSEKGIMIDSEFKRANLIANLNITPRKNMQLYTNLYFSFTDRSKGDNKSKIQGLTINPMFTSSLLPGKGSTVEEETMKRIRGVQEKNNSYNIRARMGLSYEILKGLQASADFASEYTIARRNTFNPDYLSPDKLTSSEGQIGTNLMLQTEELLNYKFDIKNTHFFDVLLGFSYLYMGAESFTGAGAGAPSNNVHYVGQDFPKIKDLHGSPTAMQSYRSSLDEQKMISLFGRLAYNYKKKYLTEFTIRRDGSSVFGEDVRWAVFPSIALGWAFSEEVFMRDYWWLSHGKLRLSRGTSGQTFEDSYLAHGLLTNGGEFLGQLGVIPQTLLNKRLTWEKSDQYDVGLDLNLLDHRIKIKFDYYYKYSKALLIKQPLPGNVYFLKDGWQNALEISNEGVELELMMDILRNTPVSWRSRFNISRNWNRFEKSYSNMDLDDRVIGRPIFGLYVYKDEGIIQKEEDIPYYYDQLGNKLPLSSSNGVYPTRVGMRKIKDMNMDGVINQKDKYYAGSTLPLAHGGFANEIKWKEWDLSILHTFTISRKIMNMYMKPSLVFSGSFGTIMTDPGKYTFWTKPNDNANFPIITATNNGYIGQYDGGLDSHIENVSYLRLKQLTLGYNCPKKWTDVLGVEGIRMFITGENLFLLSNYSGVDPEIVNPQMGIDEGVNYPLARKFTLGLTLKF